MATLDVLWTAVYAAPDDDQPRAALARRLAGTPRGELITLQLSEPSRASAARANRLIAAHRDEWLAPLGGALVKRSVRWERGFPVEGQLASQRTAAGWEAIIGLAALATLRRLALQQPNTVLRQDWLERFVFAPPLRGLRVLTGFRRALLLPMLRARPAFALECLEIPPEGGGGPSGEVAERALLAPLGQGFAAGRGLPELRELSLSFCHGISGDPANYQWLWSTALGRRLESLSINEGAYAVAAWKTALEAHPTGLRRMVFFGRNHLVLERSERGWDRLLVTPYPGLYPPEQEQLATILAALRQAGVTVTLER